MPKWSMPVLDGVCVDLYGTLVHESPHNPFYRRVASALSLDFCTWLPAYRARGNDSMAGDLPGMAERIHASSIDCGLARPIDDVRAVVEQHFGLFVDSVTVDPGTRPLLHDLRGRGLRLALVSNASSYTEQVLDTVARDLRRLFDAVVLSYRLGVLKPSPVIYHEALRAIAVSSASCVFVGDGGDQELKGARQVGLRTILINRSLKHTASARKDADVEVDSLAEVATVITVRGKAAARAHRARGGTHRAIAGDA